MNPTPRQNSPGCLKRARLVICIAGALAQIVQPRLSPAQVLTHGPVVGGVTSSGAQVFVRSNQAASVALRYGTDPNLETYQVSDAFGTDSTSDFTKIISLTNLVPETSYYLNVLVNVVPPAGPKQNLPISCHINRELERVRTP